MPAATDRAARDRERFRAAEAAIASEVIEFQEARQRVGLRSRDVVPPFSPREREVLALVAAGRSDGEIATELFITKKTASVHVANIKAKLGAASRIEIALLAVRLGLAAATGEGSGSTGAVTDVRHRVVCPFKGLASYESSDAPYFFGRERIVAELVAKLASSPFAAIVGASGSGKSSVLRAGLVPALAEGVLPGSESWVVAVLRPGTRPATELRRVAAAALQHVVVAEVGGTPLEAMPELMPGDGRLAIVVDQFEEVFTVCQDATERASFVESLVALARHPGGRGAVVLAIRADFYGRCAEFRDLAGALSSNHILVGPMAAEDLTRVVELPARAAGLRIEPDLATALVRAVVDEPGGLPLLSTTLLDLWQRRDGRSLRYATYLEIGGLTAAVSRLAEAAFGKLTPAQQVLARPILLRLASGGDDGPAVRRPAALAEFDADRNPDTAGVIATLTESRLLTVTEGAIEIAHEALLREWPRLRDWLAEDAEGRRLREHVTVAARDWALAGEEPAELYRGVRLDAALDWAAAHEPELNELERRFLAESRAASEREAVRQRQTNQRLRALLAGSGLLLLLALVAAGIAALQGGRAQQETMRAEVEAARASAEAERALQAEVIAQREASAARARELAASATTVLDDDPTLAKLLALAAASIDDPPTETITALHSALASDPVIDRYVWPAEREPSTQIVTNLSPSARYLVAVGFWGGRPHDYLEVVDRTSDTRLWSVAPDTTGIGIGYGFFSPDGSSVIYGVYRESAEPIDGDEARGEVGVFVRDTTTGALLQHWNLGPCGALVVGASVSNALIRTSEAEACFGRPFREPIAAEILDFATGARTILTRDAVLSDMGALTPDGRWVALSDRTGGRPTPVLHDLETGARSTLGADEPLVWDISPDGSLVALGDLPVRIVDVATGRATALGASAIDSAGTSYAEFGPDGRSVYTTNNNDATLHRWDPATGRETGAWVGVLEGRPSATVDGLVLVGHWGTPTAVLLDTGLRGEIAAAPTRSLAGVSHEDGLCESPRITGWGRLHVGGSRAAFTEYCFGGGFRRPDGSDLPIAPTTFVYDIPTLGVRALHGASQGWLSPDGTRLAVQESAVEGERLLTGPMRIIDLDEGDVVELQGLCTFDWRRIGSADQPSDGDSCRAFPGLPFQLVARQIRWSPDGTKVAAAGSPGPYAIWDARSGRLLDAPVVTVPPGEPSPSFDLVFTPDSMHVILAVVGRGPLDEIWRISTTTWEVERRRELAPSESGLSMIGFSARGTTLVAISDYQGGGAAIHWIDALTLDAIRAPRERLHEGIVGTATLSPDGMLLVTGSGDGSLRVRDSGTGDVVQELFFPGKSVDGVAFVDSHHVAVTLGDEGHLILMTIDEAELLTIARDSLTRGFSAEECDRFNFETCPTLQDMRTGALGGA